MVNRLKAFKNQFYNKKFAEEKSVLEKRNNKKWSRNLQKLTDKRNNKITDYLHKTSRRIVDICVENNISKVVIGNVSKSNNKINLGKRNNQNFVNISLGQLIGKLKYKLEAHNINIKVVDESYTSKASFIDNDKLPEKYVKGKKFEFSGKRIKRGLFRTSGGILINADVNGAYNIIRKETPKFSFGNLLKKLKDGVEGLLHPHYELLTYQ